MLGGAQIQPGRSFPASIQIYVNLKSTLCHVWCPNMLEGVRGEIHCAPWTRNARDQRKMIDVLIKRYNLGHSDRWRNANKATLTAAFTTEVEKNTQQNLCCGTDLRHWGQPAIAPSSDDSRVEMHYSFEFVGLICDKLLKFFSNMDTHSLLFN